MKHFYTEEEYDFLRSNVKGITLKELTNRFNKKFNTNLSEASIQNRKHKLGIKSGITGGQFQKGHTPHNKGKQWDEFLTKQQQEKIKSTLFKKGNITYNHRQLYEERVNKDDYVEIKVKEPNKWELKQRYIYKLHYGEIPKGHNIIFLDGNRRNFEISNLKAITKAEDLIMNNNKLFTSNKETTNTGHILSQVIYKTGKLKNERL